MAFGRIFHMNFIEHLVSSGVLMGHGWFRAELQMGKAELWEERRDADCPLPLYIPNPCYICA